MVLEVEEILVASRILALTGLDPNPYELSAAVHSILRRDDTLVAESRYVPDALAHVSSSTDGWVVRMADGTATDIVAGSRWEIDGVTITAVTVDVGVGKSTQGAPPSTPPLRIVARHDTVHVTPAGGETVVVSGIAARIISELAAFGTPVPWTMVAHEIWRQADERLLRQNWDRNMRTLRARLRAIGVRDDLVRPDGHGNTELFLLPDDELVDEG